MNKKIVLLGLLFLIFALLSLPWAGNNLGTVQAQMKPAGAGDSNTLGTVANHQCTIVSIAAVEVDNNSFPSENRIYVRCATSSGGGVFYYAANAVGTTNAGIANRYLVMLNTAVALGKTVTVYYDISSANNPIGCQSGDCRKLTGLVLGP
jgi:hypothetical protein